MLIRGLKRLKTAITRLGEKTMLSVTAAAGQKPIGSGPFKFVSYKSGDSITLEANKDYWGEGPYLARIIYRIIPDSNTALQAFLNNETATWAPVVRDALQAALERDFAAALPVWEAQPGIADIAEAIVMAQRLLGDA